MLRNFLRGQWGKGLVVLVVLALFGQWRLGYESRLSGEMREGKLLAPSLGMADRGMLDQKGFAAAFGSVRPVWAAMKALGAARYHVEGDWEALEESYDEIVVLDPRNVSYWDVGSWHLAYNASSASLDDVGLPPLQRRALFRDYIEKGSAFLDRGIAANPDEWRLYVLKARLWSSEFRILDYPLVVDTLRDALEVEGTPASDRDSMKRMIFYSLLRIPERRQEAYDVGVRLMAEGRRQRFPSLMNGVFVLGLDPTIAKGDRVLGMVEIYGGEREAYKNLRNYWRGRGEGTPTRGLERLLRGMEVELGVTEDSRLFRD